jgi:hypothetical protein
MNVYSIGGTIEPGVEFNRIAAGLPITYTKNNPTKESEGTTFYFYKQSIKLGLNFGYQVVNLKSILILTPGIGAGIAWNFPAERSGGWVGTVSNSVSFNSGVSLFGRMQLGYKRVHFSFRYALGLAAPISHTFYPGINLTF